TGATPIAWATVTSWSAPAPGPAPSKHTCSRSALRMERWSGKSHCRSKLAHTKPSASLRPRWSSRSKPCAARSLGLLEVGDCKVDAAAAAARFDQNLGFQQIAE